MVRTLKPHKDGLSAPGGKLGPHDIESEYGVLLIGQNRGTPASHGIEDTLQPGCDSAGIASEMRQAARALNPDDQR